MSPMTPRTPRPRAEVDDVAARPKPRPGILVPTVWLDYGTATGVTAQGQPVMAILGGRRTKHAQLVDLLNTALNQHVARLVVCGAFPADGREWLLPGEGVDWEDFLPGWEAGNPHLEGDITGRFTHVETGQKLELRTSRAWFPTYPLTPQQTQWATLELGRIVAEAVKWQGWPLLENPGATGRNLWKHLAPASYDMARMDPEIGRFIQATSPQGRNEHLVDGPSRCDCGSCLPTIAAGTQVPGFCYVDGRFMYGGVVTDDVGAAPAHWLNAADAEALFKAKPLYPARYHVRFTVPDGWDTLGLLGVKRRDQDPESGWHWPNKPGTTWETWCDSAELNLAVTQGWDEPELEIIEGIKLTKANSLQPLANATDRMLTAVAERWAGKNPAAASVLSSAIRQMYRVTIGSFSARPPLTTVTVQDPEQIPPSVETFETVRDPDTGRVTGYLYKVATRVQDPDTWHPEIASRVWALSRTRTLCTPIAKSPHNGDGKVAPKRGALDIPPEQLIGVQTDAIYTTVAPEWAFPLETQGQVAGQWTAIGGDDGRNGRMRMKGYVPGPMTVPQTRTERQELVTQAERNGYTLETFGYREAIHD